MRHYDDLTNAHLQLADENLELAQRLTSMNPTSPRWIIVVSFYSAVHYLSAYFWEHNRIEVMSHRHRAKLLVTDVSLTSLHVHYEPLYYGSLEARYRPLAEFSEDDARVRLHVDLMAIRQHVIDALDE